MMVDVIRLHPETLLSSFSKIGGFMTFFSAFSGIIFFAINSFDWKKKVKALYKDRRKNLQEDGLIAPDGIEIDRITQLDIE